MVVVQLSLIVRNIPSDDLCVGERPSNRDRFHRVSSNPEIIFCGSQSYLIGLKPVVSPKIIGISSRQYTKYNFGYCGRYSVKSSLRKSSDAR